MIVLPMKSEYKETLKDMGYMVETHGETTYGAMFFGSMLDEVRDMFNAGLTEEEVRKIVPTRYRDECDSFDVLPFSFYLNSLKDFCASRNSDGRKDSTMSLEDTLVYFAKMFNEKEKVDEDIKNLIKKFEE